jgi:hypothetical protein
MDKGGVDANTPNGDTGGPPPEVDRIALGLWQAAEALRLLIGQAEDLGLPAPTVISERLTFPVMQAFATSTQRYAEHLAKQAEARSSDLIVASPDDARRLLASMRQADQEPPHGK